MNSRKIQNPVVLSLGLHVLLVGGAFLIWLPKTANLGPVPFDVMEVAQLSPQPLRLQPEGVKPKKAVAKNAVFGVSRKSMEGAGSPIEAKSGNTLAKEPDKKTLTDSDADSIPIPTDDYLVSEMPVLISEVRVPYPETERQQRIQGPVTLELLIDSEGRVREAKVLEGPSEGLRQAALAAVLRFKFRPAKTAETSVAVKLRYVYRFVLQ